MSIGESPRQRRLHGRLWLAYRYRTHQQMAYALGIECLHLSNGQAIIYSNTLIYALINLRFLLRLWFLVPPTDRT